MANNTLLASDNFQRADGGLGANWTTLHGETACAIVSHQVEPSVLNAVCGEVYTAISWPANQISEITIGTGWVDDATNFVIPAVRIQSGAFSCYLGNIDDGAAGTAGIYRYDNAVATQLTHVTGLTIAVGDIWSITVDGACISLYQNFSRVSYTFDTTYTSGSAGIVEFASVATTKAPIASWRGYSLVQQDGIWTKQGVVVPGIASDFASSGFGVYQPSILQEGNAQILSGTVNKMWFTGGGTTANIYYAESAINDGIVWSRKAAAVLASFANGQVVKSGSTYHMYAQPSASQGTGNIAHYTSSDGISWSQVSANILGLGTAGQWDASSIFALAAPVLLSGTWYMLYVGASVASPTLFNLGVATSSDLATWTKNAGNPLLSNVVASTPVNVSGTWYMWAARGPTARMVSGLDYDPIEGIRYKSTDLLNWTAATPSVHHTQLSQGVNNTTAPEGGIAPTSIVNINGKAYLYGISCPADGSFPQVFQIGLAIAAGSIAQIVTAPEDAVQAVATDGFQRADGSLGSNWTTPTGGTALQIASHFVEPSVTNTFCQAVYAGSFNANQYSEITIQTLTGTLLQSDVYPLVLASTSALTWYEGFIGSPLNTLDIACGINKVVAGVATMLGITNTTLTPKQGDVFRLQVITGSDGFPTLSLYQNGFLILQQQDQSATPLTTGNPGIQEFSSVAIADAQISAWAGGNANVIPAYPPASSGSGDALFLLLGAGQG